MIDIKILRDSPEKIRENLEKRNIQNFPIDELFDLEKQRREIIARNQKLKEERNKISLEIPKAKSTGKPAGELIATMRNTSDEIADNDRKTEEMNSKFELLLSQLPNF